MTPTIASSILLIAAMEPNKNEFKFFEPGVKSESTAARPTPRLVTMAIAMSAFLGNFFLRKSIKSDAIKHDIIDPTTGFILIISPKATPAKALWDSASPRFEDFLQTIIVPISGIESAIKIPEAKDFIIKSYLNILTIPPPPFYL